MKKTYKDYAVLLNIGAILAKVIQIVTTYLINANTLNMQGDNTLETGLGNMFTAFVSVPLMAIFILTTFIIIMVLINVWAHDKKEIKTGNIVGLIILFVLNIIPVIAITLS